MANFHQIAKIKPILQFQLKPLGLTHLQKCLKPATIVQMFWKKNNTLHLMLLGLLKTLAYDI